MNLTVFSFLMAFVWSSLFIIVGAILQRRMSIIIYTYFYPLLLVSALSIIRLFASFEVSSSKVVRSRVIFPRIMEFMNTPLLVFRGFTLRVSAILLLVWILGIILYWLRIASRYIHFRKYTLPWKETTNHKIISLVVKITGHNNPRIKVIVVPASYTASPIFTGLIKPVIYLPDIPFTDIELEYILKHELTHYSHKDLWIKLLLNIVISIYWWNPLMLLLRKDANHLLELKSDLALVRHLSEEMRTQYLEVLLKVAKDLSGMKQNAKLLGVGIGFINSESGKKMKQRFNLVDRYKPMDKLQNIANWCVCFLMLITFSVSFLFVVQPYTEHPSDFLDSSIFTINEENAYLVVNKDGSYSLYLDGVYVIDIYDITTEPFSSINIKVNEPKEDYNEN